jgi:hypothetical protein
MSKGEREKKGVEMEKKEWMHEKRGSDGHRGA